MEDYVSLKQQADPRSAGHMSYNITPTNDSIFNIQNKPLLFNSSITKTIFNLFDLSYDNVRRISPNSKPIQGLGLITNRQHSV